MTWLITSTGRRVDLRLADPAALSIDDVAHHLAQLNRFTGACRRPYSVAEHSIHVVAVMRDEMGIDSPHALLAGLLHDAHEAYIGDLSTPLKDALDADDPDRAWRAWRRLESRVRAQVQRRFGVRAASVGYRRAIRAADLRMLATERRCLMPPGGPDWPALHGIAPSAEIWLADYDDASFDWRDWRAMFLQHYAGLRDACRAHPPPATGDDDDAL